MFTKVSRAVGYAASQVGLARKFWTRLRGPDQGNFSFIPETAGGFPSVVLVARDVIATS